MKIERIVFRDLLLTKKEMLQVEITSKELLEITGVKNDANHSFEIGRKYLIRTVTLYYTGRITSITGSDLVLSDAAWIADTGRFNDCLKNGELNEVEPFVSDVILPRSGIIDATIWDHELPRVQK